ncbi:MAG: YggS family pyridoxal phosphate-dependent enzyme, partial [Pelagibacteraceae bacterium]|nr:YggS family pyridoxal phosphate-dependent enzyme [Pelagibacteraceae bacterium]
SNSKIQLHLIGKLQTNKVKFAVKLFDFIHSVDNEKLAKKISEEQTKQTKKVKIFIQVNIGDEPQKSGISKSELQNFYFYCKNLNLNVVGLMCIPPAEKNSNIYFSEMNLLNKKLNLSELSMGMSADYLEAINNQATYVRIGSDIFGRRD